MIQKGKLNVAMTQNVSLKMTIFNNFSSKRERKTQNDTFKLEEISFRHFEQTQIKSNASK